MKPTSIIFLIVSLILAIGGFATVSVAKNMAAREGISLNASADEENSAVVIEYEYGEDAIEKISVDVKAADINIIGGSDKPYVELINFTEGMYGFSASNRVLQINEGMDLSSVSGIMSVVTSFKGLRSFVNYYDMRGLEKTVNIYICDSNPVNKVEVSLDAGDVTVSDITASTDYSISIDAGKLSMTNVNTTSLVEAEVENGEINIDKSNIQRAELDVGVGNMTIKSNIRRLDADIDVGDFNFEYSGSLEAVNLKLYAIVGSITLDGEKIAGYAQKEVLDSQNAIDVSVSTGNIIIKSAVSE